MYRIVLDGHVLHICIGLPSGPVLISWLSSVLSNQQPVLGMGRILFHLFLVACWTSRKNSQARGSDHGEETIWIKLRFLESSRHLFNYLRQARRP
jgi:hypothetical protein